MNKTAFFSLTVALILSSGTAAVAQDGRSPAAPEFRLAVKEVNELDCFDCDGVAMGDISGNGRMDLLLSTGKRVETFWYEQGATPRQWTRHTIFTEADKGTEFEGNDLGDFDGDGRLEAISLEQRRGRIYLHKHGDDPRGQWETALIRDDRPWLQSSLVTDIDSDGRLDLVYSWEGDGPGRGGIHWLKFTGSNVLNPDHWQDHVMIQHESAWWIASRRIDLNGNGRATGLVFTARNIPARNRGARPGVFWLEEPADPTRLWKRHTIDDTLNHPLHVDVGDLSGNGHGKDVVVGGFNTRHVYWYDFSRQWQRSALPLPELEGALPNRVWNVKTARFKGERDGILAPVTGEGRGALVFFEFVDGRHQPNLLLRLDYNHPMDDRIILHDIDGDGLEEAFIPDSGPGKNRLVWLKFQWREER